MMTRDRRMSTAVIVVCLTALPLFGGCESLNRFTTGFNRGLDRVILKPISKVYVAVTPKPIRKGLGNAFDNLAYPNVILNDFLQGKFRQGFGDLGRFTVNSTIGIGGLLDVATRMGLEAHDEDFGQTLGVWGAPAGPYMVLPVLGPTTLRDLPDYPVRFVTNPLLYANPPIEASVPLGVVRAADSRSRAEDSIKSRDEAAVDRYLFTREAYLQHRLFLIHDGQMPLPELPELPDDEDEDTDQSGTIPPPPPPADSPD